MRVVPLSVVTEFMVDVSRVKVHACDASTTHLQTACLSNILFLPFHHQFYCETEGSGTRNEVILSLRGRDPSLAHLRFTTTVRCFSLSSSQHTPLATNHPRFTTTVRCSHSVLSTHSLPFLVCDVVDSSNSTTKCRAAHQ
jgi:hypothetical protein